MNGHNHALFGLASYGAALTVGHEVLDMAWPGPPAIVLGAAVALGAGLVADVDQSQSIAGQGLGYVGGFVRVITGRAGGHRTLTHYPLLWVGGLSLLCWVLIEGRLRGHWFGMLCGFFAATGMPFLVGPNGRSGLGPLLDFLALAVGLGTWWGISHYGVQPDWWLYASVPVPYLAHLVGDTFTPSGVPWLHPWKRKRYGLGLFKAGGSFETTIVSPLLVLACVVALHRMSVTGALTGPWGL